MKCRQIQRKLPPKKMHLYSPGRRATQEESGGTCLVDAELSRAEEVVQAPRGCNHDLDATLDGPQLGPLGRTSVHTPALAPGDNATGDTPQQCM